MAKKYRRTARGLLGDLFVKVAPRRARRKRLSKKGVNSVFKGWR